MNKNSEIFTSTHCQYYENMTTVYFSTIKKQFISGMHAHNKLKNAITFSSTFNNFILLCITINASLSNPLILFFRKYEIY